jgi:hypothetical protein
MIVGIVLKLNREYEDLNTYLRYLRKTKCYNVPKFEDKPWYKHLYRGQWLLIYDPAKEAIIVAGKVRKQKYHPENPEFPCCNYFDPANFQTYCKIPLRMLKRVFRNFATSRRYRNVSADQFRTLMGRDA